MEIDIKKKLVRNWFKVLQDMICFEIEEIEKSKKKFICIQKRQINSNKNKFD